MASTPPSEGRPQRGIQSIEVGGQLLRVLAERGRPMALKDLASAAGMSAAKAHPYLVSFGKLGLITQDRTSGHYGIGPLARQLGLIGLQQADPVRLASERLVALAQQVGHTVALAVWGSLGPTIVRIEQGPAAIVVNMRHGTVVSVRGTASGRLFAAFGPPARQAEADLSPDEARLIRERGYAAVVDSTVPGISAGAAAVFDADAALVLALIAIGPSATFDSDADGRIATELVAAARSLSAELGAPPQALPRLWSSVESSAVDSVPDSAP
jgi:DNA-binding IclR family transcriptional regulator